MRRNMTAVYMHLGRNLPSLTCEGDETWNKATKRATKPYFEKVNITRTLARKTSRRIDFARLSCKKYMKKVTYY